MISKRRWLAAVGATALALLAPSIGTQAQEERFDGVTIRVGTWGGSWRDRMQELIGAEFEKRDGFVVREDAFNRHSTTKSVERVLRRRTPSSVATTMSSIRAPWRPAR